MRISAPEVVSRGGSATVQVTVTERNGDRVLWYSVEPTFSGFLSDAADGALVGLLVPAMADGEPLRLDGPVSARLLANARGPLQSVLQAVIPSLSRVTISAPTYDRALPAPGVATGFSGGIDSYCVLADYLYGDVAPPFKISHLLFNNVGSHGTGGETLFRSRYERLKPAASQLGIPFIQVNSNLDEFYAPSLSFTQTHTPRNASVGLVLQGGVGTLLYASSFSYRDLFVGPTQLMAYFDLVSLPLMSSEGLWAQSVGSEYSRVEKTRRVVSIVDSRTFLDVCVEGQDAGGFTNCGRCWKCARTLATLEIMGRLQEYSHVFNLHAWYQKRNRYFSQLQTSADPLLREVVDFAREQRYAFPMSTVVAALPGVRHSLEISRRIVRRLRSPG